MKEFTSAFGLADILERVIPGLLLIAALHSLLFPDRGLAYYGADKVPIAVIAVVVAYPIGVALNFFAGWAPRANRRSDIDLATDPAWRHVRDAVAAFFDTPAGGDSWRLCYGIVAKHGYSVNMELFARLDIFCRSMMTGSAIVLVAIPITALSRTVAIGWPVQVATALAAVASIASFWYGARIYSSAFAGSIYEGFYAWYRDVKTAATP